MLNRHKSTAFWLENVDRLKELLAAGTPRAEIAKAFGVSRSAVAGDVRRYIKGLKDVRTRTSTSRARSLGADATRWDESRLTETWAERKARRAEERARQLRGGAATVGHTPSQQSGDA